MQKTEGYLYSDNRYVSIEMNNGIISKIEESERKEDTGRKSHMIAPGFFDNQINGYKGIEFSKPDLSTDDMLMLVRELKKKGVLTFFPTLITASHESLMRSFRNLSKTLENTEVARAVPGFHLEGPYISPEDGFVGAHNKEHVRKPDWEEFQLLNEAARRKILQVTIAPEIDGAIGFIKNCVRNNIVVSLGHHNGTTVDIRRAVDAGAKTVTHLGNGMANTIHRFKNSLWEQLANDRLMCSLILDGFHLPAEAVKVFYRAKGPAGIILTSDMTMLAGMTPGKYEWDGKEVVLTKEGIIMLKKENCFAGASLPIHVGVGNMMKFTGCSLKDAIDMATKNPSGLYGLEARTAIETGRQANLILFDVIDGEIRIVETYS